MKKNKLINADVNVESGFLVVTKDGKTPRFELRKISERLSKASEAQLNQFAISPSGYGIHWYAIDEDISNPALLNEPVSSYEKNQKGS